MDASAARLLGSIAVENDRPSLEAIAGSRVRELRKARGWSQAALAVRLRKYGPELTQSTIAKLEAGARPTRLDEFGSLAEVLGVPLTYLIAMPDPFGSPDERFLEREIREIEAALDDAKARASEAQLRSAAADAERTELLHLAEDLRAQLDNARIRLADLRAGKEPTHGVDQEEA